MDRSNFWKLEGINGNHDGTVICSIARDNRVSSIWNTGPIVAETLTDESEHDVFAEKIGAIDPFVKFFSLNYRYRTNKSWTKKIPCSSLIWTRVVCANYRIDQDNIRAFQVKANGYVSRLSINYYGALINFTGFIRQIKINYHIIESNRVETNYTITINNKFVITSAVHLIIRSFHFQKILNAKQNPPINRIVIPKLYFFYFSPTSNLCAVMINLSLRTYE